MLARSAQFTLKNKTKHHPFPPEEVPYPRSYDHKCIDTDVWESMFCEQFCGNVTFHTFDVPPTKVYVSIQFSRRRPNSHLFRIRVIGTTDLTSDVVPGHGS